MCSLPKRSFWETNQGMSVRREKYLQRRGEHWHSLLTDFPLSSHFHLTTCLRSDVKAARCVFDCLCLCGAVCVSVCGLGGFVAAECVVLFPAAMCLTYNEFVRQSVKITTTSKSFIREQILIISNPVTFQRSLENTNGITMPYFRIETNKTTFMYLNL